jgi:hypothetical protein
MLPLSRASERMSRMHGSLIGLQQADLENKAGLTASLKDISLMLLTDGPFIRNPFSSARSSSVSCGRKVISRKNTRST